MFVVVVVVIIFESMLEKKDKIFRQFYLVNDKHEFHRRIGFLFIDRPCPGRSNGETKKQYHLFNIDDDGAVEKRRYLNGE